MQDDETASSPREPARTKAPMPDEEPSAELSRAAREAVRQPPDPRLEKQFAHLALWGEPEPAATPPEQPGGSPADDSEAVRLREAITELQAASTAIEGRLDGLLRLLAIVIRMLVVLTVVVVGLVILVLARSLG
jgi:hypothetical protein